MNAPVARPRPFPEIVAERLHRINRNAQEFSEIIRNLKGMPPNKGYSGLITQVLNNRRSPPLADLDVWIRALGYLEGDSEVAELRAAAAAHRAKQTKAGRQVLDAVGDLRARVAELEAENARLRRKLGVPTKRAK